MVLTTLHMNDLKLSRALLAPHVQICNKFWCVHLVTMQAEYSAVHNVAFDISSVAKQF